MKFTKMHGTGNDYIYVNGFEEKLENPSEAAVKLSDRRFGIGSATAGTALTGAGAACTCTGAVPPALRKRRSTA